ncbi:MAG: cob(I)yrinic acid a,c-diamide adenosyltransferase [Caulobacterales bacterium]
MVRLDKIVTKTGDKGTTRLATGEEVSKGSLRVEAYGGVDETNSAIGVARLYVSGELDAILARVQNDLFDLGADLATPERDKPLPFEALRITDAQVDRLETEAEALNERLEPLTSFILPGGLPAAAHLHLARAIARRAERTIALLMMEVNENVSPAALKYLNRCSDLLFVAARFANDAGKADVLWTPGANRQ